MKCQQFESQNELKLYNFGETFFSMKYAAMPTLTEELKSTLGVFSKDPWTKVSIHRSNFFFSHTVSLQRWT